MSNHQPPPPSLLSTLMGKFVHWLNTAHNLHPVRHAALAHYKLVFIHPFMDGNGELHTCHRTSHIKESRIPPPYIWFDSALEDEFNARLKCCTQDVSSSGKEKSIIRIMPISLITQCSFILITKARTKPETWHQYLPPSSISNWTLSSVLGHIKYNFFPPNNIAFFCLCF